MSQPVDRHLLFGLLALQNGLITREQLMAAFSAWTGNKTQSLDQLLVEQGALPESQSRTLNDLVDLHFQRTRADTWQSLQTLVDSDMRATRAELEQLHDADIARSIANLELPAQKSGKPNRSGDNRKLSSLGGRFRVLRPLEGGEGGMGVINIAEDEELGREVALKQIRGDRIGKEVFREKFKQEAEITGNLEHPGIVPIYGLGSDVSGRPYYAMRLVKGDNLRNAIRQFHKRLALGKLDYNSVEFRNLIDRLIDVAQAISYAHSRGVLHRDLKPGNVMVGKYGETLVIDWGLARPPRDKPVDDDRSESQMLESSGMLDLRSGSNAPLTAHGSMIGTLGYAPPEQVLGNLDQMNTTSDIYGLGAMLYQILTGTTTVHLKNLSLDDVKRQVVEGRIDPPIKFSREIPKPLDAICMKALATDPADRYQSADELVDELERWKADQPVSARKESTLERLGRLTRKHRSATLATVAALICIVFVSTAALLAVNHQRRKADAAAIAEKEQRLEAEKQRKKAAELADAERDAKTRAQQLAARNQRVVDAFVAAFSSPNPANEGVSGGMSARQVLDQARLQLDSKGEMADDPLTRATLLQAIGSSLLALGAFDEAVEALELCLELRIEHSPDDTPAMLVSQINLATAWMKIGQLEESQALFEKAFQLSNTRFGKEHDYTLRTMNGLALNYQTSGKTDDALNLLSEVLEIRTRVFGRSHPETISAMTNLAMTSYLCGRYEEAIKYYEEAFELQKKNLGPTHPYTLATMSLLGGAYQDVGRMDDALAMYKQSAQLSKEKLGESHPDALTSAVNLARGEMAVGNLDKAIELLERTLELSKAGLGDKHFQTILNMNNVATAYAQKGRLADAIKLAREALKLQREQYGNEHPGTPHIMATLAGAYKYSGKLDDALQLFKQVLELRTNTLGPDHPDTIASKYHLGGLYHDLGRHQEASKLLREAYDSFLERFGEGHRQTLDAMQTLAANIRETGRRDDALKMLEKLHNLSRAHLGKDHPTSLSAATSLAKHYYVDGRNEEAVSLFEEAWPIAEHQFGEFNDQTFAVLGELVAGYYDLGQAGKVVAIFERLLDSAESNPEVDDDTKFQIKYQLIYGLYEIGRVDEGFALAKKTIADLKAIKGASDQETITYMQQIAYVCFSRNQLDEAITLYSELLQTCRNLFGPSNSDTLQITREYSFVLIRAGLFERVEILSKEWMTAVENSAAVNPTEATGAVATLAEALIGQSRFDEAETAIERMSAMPGLESTDRLQIKNLQGVILASREEWKQAEPLLIESANGLAEELVSVDYRWYLQLVYQRLIDFYTAWDRPEQAAEWEQKRRQLVNDTSEAASGN